MSLTQKRLRELLKYDPETGLFYWRPRPSQTRAWNTRYAGTIAGTVRPDNGYVKIGLEKRNYKAHRLAWLYMAGAWPAHDVDHKNGDRADNRWSNLRAATRTFNNANSSVRSDSTIGLKGVVRCRDRFHARLTFQGTKYHLGAFDTPEEAHAAYCAKAKEVFGEFARAA